MTVVNGLLCSEDVIYLVLHYSVIVEGHGNFGGELCEGEGRLLDDSDRRAIGGGVKVAEEDCGKRILLIHRRESIEKKRYAEDSRLIGDVVEVGIADSDESACCALSVHADAGYSRAGGLLGKARAGDARRGAEPKGIDAVTDQAILQGGDGYSLSVKMLAAEEDIKIVDIRERSLKEIGDVRRHLLKGDQVGTLGAELVAYHSRSVHK